MSQALLASGRLLAGWRLAVGIAIALFLVLVPRLLPPFQTLQLSYGLIFAIAALGFNLLLGYTGLLQDELAGMSDAARDLLAEQGYDPTYGARPLKRVIQQRIQNPLAVEMLKQEFGEGSRVKIDYRDGEFTFERSE